MTLYCSPSTRNMSTNPDLSRVLIVLTLMQGWVSSFGSMPTSSKFVNIKEGVLIDRGGLKAPLGAFPKVTFALRAACCKAFLYKFKRGECEKLLGLLWVLQDLERIELTHVSRISLAGPCAW